MEENGKSKELIRIEALESDERREDEHEDVIELALELGRALIETGGELQRAEYAAEKLCRAYGAVATDTYATGTVIILTAEFENGNRTTRSVRVRKDTVDLRAFERINSLSREFCETAPPPEEAERRLKAVIGQKTAPLWQEIAGVALGSAGMTVASMGSLPDGLMAAVAAALVISLNYYFSRVVGKFVTTALTAFLASTFCILFYAAGAGDNLPTMITGEILVLVPGLTILSAMRDMLSGNVESGATRFLQSVLVAFGLALGVALALLVFEPLVGDAMNATVTSGIGGDVFPVVRVASSVVGALGFSLYFHIEYKRIPFTLANVFVTMLIICLMEYAGGVEQVFFRTLAASFAVTLISEILASRLKAPAVVFLTSALLPMLPGTNMYLFMSYMVSGDYGLMAQNLIVAFQGALGIACGILAVGAFATGIRRFAERVRSLRKKIGKDR